MITKFDCPDEATALLAVNKLIDGGFSAINLGSAVVTNCGFELQDDVFNYCLIDCSARATEPTDSDIKKLNEWIKMTSELSGVML